MQILARVKTALQAVAIGVPTAVTMFREDPFLLVAQATRRVPRRVTSAAASLARALSMGKRLPDPWRLTELWLRGQREAVRALIESSSFERYRGVKYRLVAAIAVDVGANTDQLQLSEATQARQAWNLGDISTALALAPTGSVLAKRLASEVVIIQPEFRVSQPVGQKPPGSKTGQPRVFHLLMNSLPHTHSGYSIRSHQVLSCQLAAGVAVSAATRLGYPISVGKLTSAPSDTIDGLTYQRLNTWRYPMLAEDFLRAHATQALRRARRLKPNLIHTTTGYLNGMVAQSVAHSLQVPWAYEVRGMLEESWAARQATVAQEKLVRASSRHGLLRRKEAQLASEADLVFTLSQAMKADVVWEHQYSSPGFIFLMGVGLVHGMLLGFQITGNGAWNYTLKRPGFSSYVDVSWV